MTIFRNVLILSTAMTATGVCFAQEVGRVISSQPILQQVAIPRQVCSTEQVSVQPQKSGAGAVMGAIAGGAMGNAVGRGAGNAAATVLGIVGGAIVGDRIEGSPAPQMQTVQNCANQNFYENRTKCPMTRAPPFSCRFHRWECNHKRPWWLNPGPSIPPTTFSPITHPSV